MSKKRKGKETGEGTESGRHYELWAGFALGVLILIFYANSFATPLLFDSDTIIHGDTRLRAVNSANLEQIFANGYWWPTQENSLYRPLTTLTYLFNYAILGNGSNPGGYHVVNFLLHWANAWLVLLLIHRLSGRFDVAFLTAALFALHPVNTEAVTNVVGRADLLAALSILLGGMCFLFSLESPAYRIYGLVAMCLIACCGVLTKENAVMLVAFLALFDFLWRWPLLAAGNWVDRLKAAVRKFGASYLALAPSLILIAFIRGWMSNRTPLYGDLFGDNPLFAASWFQRFMTAIGVVGRDLKLLAFPRTLTPDYSFNQIPVYGTTGNAGADSFLWISLLLVFVLIGGALWLRREKFAAFAVLFLFVTMLPTSNLMVTIGSIMAERFLYLPSIGFCALAAVGLLTAGRGLAGLSQNAAMKGIIYWSLPLIVIVAFGGRTFARNADWHDDLSFWKSSVAASPASFKTHMAYGDALWTDAQQQKKPLLEAIERTIQQEETAKAILEPEPPLPLRWQNKSVYMRLGQYYRIKGDLLDSAGRHDEAMQYYEKSVVPLVKADTLDRLANQTWRDFKTSQGVPAGEIADNGTPLLYQFLGVSYAKLGQWENCEKAALYMEHIAPGQAGAYQLAGTAAFNLAHYEAAAVDFLAGQVVDSKYSDWLKSLRLTYTRMGVEPNPITIGANALSLNQSLPLVRQELNEAEVMVMKLFEAAKMSAQAREIQDKFNREYSAPASAHN